MLLRLRSMHSGSLVSRESGLLTFATGLPADSDGGFGSQQFENMTDCFLTKGQQVTKTIGQQREDQVIVIHPGLTETFCDQTGHAFRRPLQVRLGIGLENEQITIFVAAQIEARNCAQIEFKKNVACQASHQSELLGVMPRIQTVAAIPGNWTSVH